MAQTVADSPSADGMSALSKVFSSHEFRFTRAGQPTRMLDYRLFTPQDAKAKEIYPLIIWMHGRGEYEHSVRNLGQLKWLDTLIFRDLARLDQYRFYLLALQCPANCSWDEPLGRGDVGDGNFDAIDALSSLIEELCHSEEIDARRIYLVGISDGGRAAWEMGLRDGRKFAALAPLGYVLTDSPRLEALVETPVWTFRSTADVDPPIAITKSTMRRFRSLGGKIELTEPPTGEHNCWISAFQDYDLLNWLLSQSKDCKTCPDPGSVSWRVRAKRVSTKLDSAWPAMLVLVMGCLILIAVQRERVRRATAKRG